LSALVIKDFEDVGGVIGVRARTTAAARAAVPAHPGRSLPRPSAQAASRGAGVPAQQLLREIRELGYQGSSNLLVRSFAAMLDPTRKRAQAAAVDHRRTRRRPASPALVHPRPRPRHRGRHCCTDPPAPQRPHRRRQRQELL